MDNKQKRLCMIAILIAFISFAYASSITTSTTNQTLGLNIVVNNTNLAPTIEPSVPGTGERTTGTTYFNNNSDIEIFLYSHASAANQTSDIQLLINGTMVSSVSSKPVGGVEQNNKSIVAVIPRYSQYKAIFDNYHHYEWREYQILSGNFTSNITSNCSGCVNQTQLNEKVNKSGDTMSGNLNIDGYGLITSKSHVHLESSPTPLVRLGVEDINNSYLEVFQDSINFSFINGTSIFYTLNKTGLDMQNKNITNCANCPPFGITQNISLTVDTGNFEQTCIASTPLTVTSGSISNINDSIISTNAVVQGAVSTKVWFMLDCGSPVSVTRVVLRNWYETGAGDSGFNISYSNTSINSTSSQLQFGSSFSASTSTINTSITNGAVVGRYFALLRFGDFHTNTIGLGEFEISGTASKTMVFVNGSLVNYV